MRASRRRLPLPELALAVVALVATLRITGLGGDLATALAAWLPIDPSSIDPLEAATAAAGLWAIALAVWRRKRLAWPLAFVYFLFVAVSQALVLRHPLGAALAVICLVILIGDARRYQSATDRRMRFLAIMIMVGGAILLVGGSILVNLVAAAPRGSVLDLVAQWISAALGFTDPSQFAPPLQVAAAMESIESSIQLVLLVAALAVLAADPDRPAASKIEHDRAVARRYARGALAPFQLGPDKLLYSDPEGGGVIAYGRAGRTAVMLGDPIGPPEAAGLTDRTGGAIGSPDAAWRTFRAFEERCRLGDVNVSIYQTSRASAVALRDLGYRTFRVGQEAIVNLAAFDLSSPRTANLRHTVTRAGRGGIAVAWYPAGLDPEGLRRWAAELIEVDRAWQVDHGPAMQFTLSPFDLESLTTAGLAIASDPAGRVEAFVTYRRIDSNAWVLDITRRRARAVPGALESCITTAAAAMRVAGDSELSLGLVALAGLSWKAGPAEERILAVSRACVRSVYSITGLLFFKAKFDPEWRPRYGAVRGGSGIIGYLIALLRLHFAVRVAAPPPALRPTV